MDNKELYINFDEYIRQGEPSQREAAYIRARPHAMQTMMTKKKLIELSSIKGRVRMK
jgi:hypothetical protein